jgi:hypothetical protein
VAAQVPPVADISVTVEVIVLNDVEEVNPTCQAADEDPTAGVPSQLMTRSSTKYASLVVTVHPDGIVAVTYERVAAVFSTGISDVEAKGKLSGPPTGA